ERAAGTTLGNERCLPLSWLCFFCTFIMKTGCLQLCKLACIFPRGSSSCSNIRYIKGCPNMLMVCLRALVDNMFDLYPYIFGQIIYRFVGLLPYFRLLHAYVGLVANNQHCGPVKNPRGKSGGIPVLWESYWLFSLVPEKI
uniref:Uncharacterized protein n=1 Tax=Gopherus evgoodei TaxID=1825980 RepID=A0A8C4W717_9SAUR